MKENKLASFKALALLLAIAGIMNFSGEVLAKEKMMKHNDGSSKVVSRYPFKKTVNTLKRAIEDQNLMVIFEVDGQKMLRMAKKKVKGMKQIFYFHPKYMRRVMEANKMASIQIPLKFIVMENPDGKVVVRYFKPSVVLNPYPGEKAVAKELDGLVKNIVAEISVQRKKK